MWRALFLLPNPRSGESRDDFVDRCMGDDEAVGDFPDSDQRFAFCNSVYEDAKSAKHPTTRKRRKRKMSDQVRFAIASTRLQSSNLRTAEFMGRDYLVVPAVLVQGQILHNNLGATFLPPEEITQAWAEEWNGVPVIAHDHPSQRGVSVSARTPEMLDSCGAGYVFHAHASRNGTVQLKAEVWLDLGRVAQVPELETIIARLRAGEHVELSTGFGVTTDDEPGVHNGQAYEKILHPVGADHLAIFIDKVGACSLDDGCGLGVQERIELTIQALNVGSFVDLLKKEGLDVPDTKGVEKGQVLTLMERLAGLLHPSSSTENQGRGAEFRLLLLRLKSLAMTNEEIGKSIGRSASTIGLIERGEIIDPSSESLEKLRTLMKRFSKNAEHDHSDEERRMMLAKALDEEFGGANKIVWIDSVFSDRKEVVFGVVMEDLTGHIEQLFSATFNAADDGEVSFTDPTEVVRRVIFEPVGNTEEGDSVGEKTAEQVAAEKKEAAENKAAEDKAAVAKEAADKKAAADQEAAENKAAKDKAAEDEAARKKLADESEAATAVIATLREKIEAQGKEIAEMRTDLKPAVDERERERQTLVDELAANDQVPFDKAELEAKPLEELRKFRAMSRRESYAGRGGPTVATHEEAEAQYAEPVPYFATNKGDKKEDE